MNLNHYLEHIGYTGAIEPAADVLKCMHKLHTFTIPFENLDISRKHEITIDTTRFYDKIVQQKRGGFCYEMNGLFDAMLQQVGFKSYFISCNVFIPQLNIYGADFGHVAIIVNLGDEIYLADVGFGDAFVEPLKIVMDEPQEQYGTYYKLSQLSSEEILLEKSANDITYIPMFKFTLQERKLEDFSEMCAFHQRSPLAPFTKGRIVSKAVPHGRITLTEKALFKTIHGNKSEEIIHDEQEFNHLLHTCFGIHLMN
jgi:N-hydroxyarylamine O-acetyltransferase